MKSATCIGLAVGWICLTGLAHGQEGETPDILHTGPGHITWANVDTSMYYTVEWRNALTTGELWQSVYDQFWDVQSQADTITRQIPTFFRVRAYPVPEFIRYLTATSHWMTAGYYAEDVDLTAVDPNLAAGNILGGVSIFGVAGAVIEADGDAESAQVLEGGTFSKAGAAGLTGTMPNRGAQNVMPGTAAQAILQGYHDGTGEVAGDAALTSANIRGGATIFGVDGKPEVVDTEDADAQASHLLKDRSAYVGGVRVTGTIEPRTLSADSEAVAAGYYEATTLSAVDPNLTAENVRGGTTVFGITGTVLPATGDATPEVVLEGRTFSNTEASGATGIMPNRGAQNVTPGTAAQTILLGYHDGTGEVAGDADLAAGNIKAGVNIFGVDGNVVESTGDAAVGQVLVGATFSKAGEAGLTGTMPDQGARGFMPGAADVTIPAGYYSGAGVVTGDAALVTGNIRGGATLFGVEGKPAVVDTEDGTAVAADLMEGKVAFVAGNAVTGTIATVTLSDTTTLVQAGYIAATNLALVDADLAAGNIRSGVTLFGLPGTVLQATGGALAEHVLTGQTFSRADAVDVAGTMANRGAQNVAPGTTAQAILLGYHDGTGEVAGDTDLAADNIKAGVNIFGVDGNMVESTGDATAGQVLAGATFSKAGEAGLTGTMPDQGGRGFMPGAADVTIPAGYYSGAGVVTGDAALVTGNIRAGSTIFGVAGDPNVVDTAAGDATTADLLADRVAYVGGSAVTGTIATLTLSSDSAEVAEGFYAVTNLKAVETNLTSNNIPYGITMFGIQGSGNPKSGIALIPAGDFVKTDHPDDSNWVTNYISAFYLSRTHITKAQWDVVRSWGSTNGYTDLPVGGGKGVDHPVQAVNWYAMVKWCNARSAMEGRPPVYFTDGNQTTVYRTGSLDLTNACVAWTSPGYRLPTESEWEKAARGGLHAHRFPWGHTTNMISHVQANFRNNGGEAYQYGTTGYHPDYTAGGEPYTSPVGSFAPNGYGLHDMAGNVWDWCWDRDVAAGSYYVAGSDLRGYDTGSARVIRGGSWNSFAIRCRSAFRINNFPNNADFSIGFRVALPPGQ